jgi:peroxiredoxin
MRNLLLAAGLLVASTPHLAADDAKSSAATAAKREATEKPDANLEAETAKVQNASKARMAKLEVEFAPRFAAVKKGAEWEEALRAFHAAGLDLQMADREAIKKLMPLLRRSAANPAAVRGLTNAAFNGYDADRQEAGSLLRRHHLTHPAVVQVAENSGVLASEAWIEPLIRDLLAKESIPAKNRARLRYSLATNLKGQAGLPASIASNPARTEMLGAERAARLITLDVPKLETEALKLFDELVAEKAEGELAPGLTIVTAARSAAHEIRNLSVGKLAPEIIGEDLDGRPMRLSDYRGKVVMLTFWGSRCSPCVELALHERELVKRFAGRPFTPVGVSIDPDREAAKRVIEQHQFTWRSFWSGTKGWFDDLPMTWNVHSIPVLYVLDHKGVIRSKKARGPVLDRLIEELVAQAEAAGQ